MKTLFCNGAIAMYVVGRWILNQTSVVCVPVECAGSIATDVEYAAERHFAITMYLIGYMTGEVKKFKRK